MIRHHTQRIALALTLVVLASTAHAVDVTFRCRMSEQIRMGLFNPTLEFVDVAGTFNGWGSDPMTPLADADGDTIHEVVVDGFSDGETIEYKFRYNGQWDGREEFPGYGNNRFYTVQPADNVIDVWYNDYEPGSGTVEPGELHWWNDAVFYEIYVRGFQDSDGDGIGDLPGLTSRLDHLNDGDPATDDDLGVTGIWLMPINPSPTVHGYDAVDYYAVNPDYGTLADFQTFLAEAHARGIKVIIDLVLNHCSNQHPWFTASALEDPQYRDWFRWSASDPGETGPWGQDVWHWGASGWYYGLFWGGMPDLNYETPAVKAEMFDVAAYWLDTVGVDGFRLDAVLYIHEQPGQLMNTPETFQFWQDYTSHVKSVEPDAFSVGEAWTASSTVVQYVEQDRLDVCFEFDLAYAMLAAVNGADAVYLASKASQVYNLYPYLQYATFLTNHDQNRSFSWLGQDVGKAKAAAALYLLQPGVPFLYYGEEIGMTGEGPHEYVRTPMQWDGGPNAGFTTGTPWFPVNDDYVVRNVADLDVDPNTLLNWYRKLIHTRNGSSALRRGEYIPLTSSKAPVMAFLRDDGDQLVLCLVNTSAFAQGGITLTGTAASLTPGVMEVVDLLDSSDVRTLVVTGDHEIESLGMAAFEARAYEVTAATGAEPDPGAPPRSGLRLEPARPNPFNPSTTIRYDLPEAAHVRLAVFDLAGREVAVLRDGVQAAGSHAARWDGLDAAGRSVGAGTYLLRLSTGADERLAKISLVK